MGWVGLGGVIANVREGTNGFSNLPSSHICLSHIIRRTKSWNCPCLNPACSLCNTKRHTQTQTHSISFISSPSLSDSLYVPSFLIFFLFNLKSLPFFTSFPSSLFTPPTCRNGGLEEPTTDYCVKNTRKKL